MMGEEKGKLAALCISASVIFGILAAYAVVNYLPKSQLDAAKEFYDIETAMSVSPSDYIYDLKAGTRAGLVVDLRTPAQYNAGHLVTSVNVPAGQMSEEQIVAAFRRLPSDKPFITYCYSSYCMLSRKVGKTLADKGIFSKHLTAGWLEIQRDYPGYVVNGSEPGSLSVSENETVGVCDPTGEGEFGC